MWSKIVKNNVNNVINAMQRKSWNYLPDFTKSLKKRATRRI